MSTIKKPVYATRRKIYRKAHRHGLVNPKITIGITGKEISGSVVANGVEIIAVASQNGYKHARGALLTGKWNLQPAPA